MALHQHTCAQGRRHPPPRAHGHLKEPLLERESAHHGLPASKHIRHGGLLVSVRERLCARVWIMAESWTLVYKSERRVAVRTRTPVSVAHDNYSK
jgi:hypothetical protein